MQKPNGVVKFLSHFNSDSHARFTGAGCPTGRGARLKLPTARRGAAKRGKRRGPRAGGGGLCRPGRAGKGAGGRGARFRGLRGRGRRFGSRAWVPGLESGSGPGSCSATAWPEAQQVGRSRGGAAAAGGRKSAGPGGPGRRGAGGTLSSPSRRRLRVRPLRAEDACPRVASSKTTAGG